MTADEKWTKANRLTKAVRHEIREEVIGSELAPSAEELRKVDPDQFSSAKDGDRVWTVIFFFQTGLDQTDLAMSHYLNAERAEKAAYEFGLVRIAVAETPYPERTPGTQGHRYCDDAVLVQRQEIAAGLLLALEGHRPADVLVG